MASYVTYSASPTAAPDAAPDSLDMLRRHVRQYIADNFLMGASEAKLGDDDSFMAQQVIDSFGVLELVSFIEATFGIKVDETEMVAGNLDSVNGIVRYLQGKLDGAV